MLLLTLFFSILSFAEIKFVKCSYSLALNSNFLHLNDVSVHCDRESSESYPYDVALIKCYSDNNCVYVKVEEFDVYLEKYGISKLCYSSNLSGLYPIHNGRVSIKIGKLSENYEKLYKIYSNRKALCRSGQIIGQLEPVSSYSEVARECQRLNCDYFTVAFYEDKNKEAGMEQNSIIRTSSALFCVGEPLGLYSEGHLMGERNQNK